MFHYLNSRLEHFFAWYKVRISLAIPLNSLDIFFDYIYLVISEEYHVSFILKSIVIFVIFFCSLLLLRNFGTIVCMLVVT